MFNLINVNDLDLRNTIKSEIDVDVNLNLDDDIIDINSSYNNNQKL
ncbi:MAG: hypothetical protein P1U46_00135 [Patescibacteria group bacterium]|nr:hypothetical protein [Patescibacteria group bacterium]